MASYRFDLSKTADVEAAVLSVLAFVGTYLATGDLHTSLETAFVAGSGVIGYTGIAPATA